MANSQVNEAYAVEENGPDGQGEKQNGAPSCTLEGVETEYGSSGSQLESSSASEGQSKEEGGEEKKKAPLWVRILKAIFKTICLLILAYLFICSLELQSSAFRLVGGSLIGMILL